MLRFVADYTRPDGLAPQVGDADDGRYLPLGDYGRLDPRSHLHLFTQAQRPYSAPSEHAAYPDGGYWVMRAGDLYALVRCGDVGVGGLGSHAHNDALSFELACGAQPLIIDPGSYLYTADPRERDRFRSHRVSQHACDRWPRAEPDLRDGAVLHGRPPSRGARQLGPRSGTAFDRRPPSRLRGVGPAGDALAPDRARHGTDARS